MPERANVRELAQQLFSDSRGDALGLRHDPELRLILADSVAEQFRQSLDPKLLLDWEAMISELEASDSTRWSPELKWQLQAHRRMLDTLKKLGRARVASETSKRLTKPYWVRRKSKMLRSRSAQVALAATQRLPRA
ncbi:hypothetical protein ACNOYE_16250 [Nannocystaceae bacterium ST9]